MKKFVSTVVLSLFVAGPLLAQPILLEQASNVVPAKTLEIGIDNLEYGADVTEIEDTDYKLTRTSMIVPLIARYAYTDSLEATLTIPYTSLSYKEETGGASASVSDAQLSDIALACKKSFVSGAWNLAAGLSVSLPTGSQSDDFPLEFKKGLNFTPVLAASKGFTCPVTGLAMTFDANLSYALTGEYDDKAEVKRDPADVLTAGLGLEHAMPGALFNKDLTLGAEFFYKNLSDQKNDGVTDPTSGSQLDLVLGGRCAVAKDIKTKLGVAFSFGEEKYREFDWKLLLGVTYLMNI